MLVFINQEPKEITQQTTLSEVVEQFAASPLGIAVAINLSVVPKSQWASTFLNPNDTILIIKATQGG